MDRSEGAIKTSITGLLLVLRDELTVQGSNLNQQWRTEPDKRHKTTKRMINVMADVRDGNGKTRNGLAL